MNAMVIIDNSKLRMLTEDPEIRRAVPCLASKTEDAPRRSGCSECEARRGELDRLKSCLMTITENAGKLIARKLGARQMRLYIVEGNVTRSVTVRLMSKIQ